MNEIERQRVLKRFNSKVIKTESGCWEWKASHFWTGYARLQALGENKASRVSYRLFVGNIDEGLLVLHACDNKGCVNPKHLFLGTYQDNMDDMYAKNRGPTGSKNGRHTKPEKTARGERQHSAKLTNKKVLEIRRRYKEEEVTKRRLAKEYGVSTVTITAVIQRRSWKHVKEEVV